MKTLIIDNFDSFTYNLYQFIGELGGSPTVLRNNQMRVADIKRGKYSHIVISPGPGSPDDPKYFGICKEVIEKLGSRVPILGVCLGHQGIISVFGGKIIRALSIKHGKQSLIKHDGKGIFDGVKNPILGMRYHSLVGKKEIMSDELEVTAESIDDGEIMGVKHKRNPIFGVQFHPESIGTEGGKRILQNFLRIADPASRNFNLGVLPRVSLAASAPPKVRAGGSPSTRVTPNKINVSFILHKLIEKKDLSLSQATELMGEILKGNLTSVYISSLLTALRMKGETTDEIKGFIEAMRKNMEKIRTEGVVVDTCGTGGDGKGTFNISTAVSLVVAAGGVGVAKHGNRSASSLCGSADVLERLGVNIQLNPEQAERVFRKIGITFLFAPLFHKSIKYVTAVRKELGFRTVFNFLGPFASPAGVKRQIIGVPNLSSAKKLAMVARKLLPEHLLIVTSDEGLDEISISGNTHVFEIKKDRFFYKKINPKIFGFRESTIESIKGGDASLNADIINKVLDGEKGARRDIVLLNSAAALYIGGRVKNIKEGIKLAEESIDSGGAKNILHKFIQESQKYA